ncbi:HI0074 family nucleotidyltransferase substrate-binding subunit [Thermovibrio sp.]
MTDSLRVKLESLEKAYTRLKEALELPVEESSIVLDAVIQRFEFTFELLWKAIKRFAEALGAGEYSSAMSFIKLAYKLGWIEDEEKWLSLLQARNLTSHTYSYETALEVCRIIENAYPSFEKLILSLKRELQNF